MNGFAIAGILSSVAAFLLAFAGLLSVNRGKGPTGMMLVTIGMMFTSIGMMFAVLSSQQ